MSGKDFQSSYEHAKFYRGNGLATFPCHDAREVNGRFLCGCGRPDCGSPGKHPVAKLAPNGLKDASKLADKVCYNFCDRTHNVAIATGQVSGIVVVDVDPRHGGNESLAALETEYGSLPKTWRSETGGGGQHIFFKHPGENLPNSASKLGPGLDVRGDGGYVIAPPSRHISGNFYRWPKQYRPSQTQLAPIPPWLLEKIMPRGKTTPTADRSELQSLLQDGVGEGERNDAMARLSGLLLGKGVDPHICLDLLLAFNDARCSPPLDDEEVTRTVASILKSEQSSRRKNKLRGRRHD
jgi:hypothetical protein